MLCCVFFTILKTFDRKLCYFGFLVYSAAKFYSNKKRSNAGTLFKYWGKIVLTNGLWHNRRISRYQLLLSVNANVNIIFINTKLKTTIVIVSCQDLTSVVSPSHCFNGLRQHLLRYLIASSRIILEKTSRDYYFKTTNNEYITIMLQQLWFGTCMLNYRNTYGLDVLKRKARK